ncbi:MAG: hypothetical protein IT192_07715 [Microbacteriaceae bacterium]|nr:hypothetical protein [Microbacteriaceae bacterium]
MEALNTKLAQLTFEELRRSAANLEQYVEKLIEVIGFELGYSDNEDQFVGKTVPDRVIQLGLTPPELDLQEFRFLDETDLRWRLDLAEILEDLIAERIESAKFR